MEKAVGIRPGRRRREVIALSNTFIILLCFVGLVLISILNLLPRTIELFSIMQNSGNFDKQRELIIQATQKKGELEKAIQSRVSLSDINFKGNDSYAILLTIAKECGLRLEKIEEYEALSENDNGGYGLKVKLNGQFSELEIFISKLESLSTPVAMRLLNITTPDIVSNDLNCEIGVLFLKSE